MNISNPIYRKYLHNTIVFIVFTLIGFNAFAQNEKPEIPKQTKEYIDSIGSNINIQIDELKTQVTNEINRIGSKLDTLSKSFIKTNDSLKNLIEQNSINSYLITLIDGTKVKAKEIIKLGVEKVEYKENDITTEIETAKILTVHGINKNGNVINLLKEYNQLSASAMLKKQLKINKLEKKKALLVCSAPQNQIQTKKQNTDFTKPQGDTTFSQTQTEKKDSLSAKPTGNNTANNNLSINVFNVITLETQVSKTKKNIRYEYRLEQNKVRYKLGNEKRTQTPKIVFGIDAGWRGLIDPGKNLYQPTLLSKPGEDTIRLYFDKGNRGSISAGISVTAYPFKEWPKFMWCRYLGFTTNINLLKYMNVSNDSDTKVKASGLEGGIGIAYEFGKSLSVAFTLEKVFIRSIRQAYITNYEGKPVTPEIIDYIKNDNDLFYKTERANALCIKFIYNLNTIKTLSEGNKNNIK